MISLQELHLTQSPSGTWMRRCSTACLGLRIFLNHAISIESPSLGAGPPGGCRNSTDPPMAGQANESTEAWVGGGDEGLDIPAEARVQGRVTVDKSVYLHLLTWSYQRHCGGPTRGRSSFATRLSRRWADGSRRVPGSLPGSLR